MDLGEMLASDAAQEIVKAIAGGLVEVVKRIPSLWHRAGGRRELLIKEEIERSARALEGAADDLPVVMARQEGAWDGRLRDLLAEYPDAVVDVRRMLEEIRHLSSHLPQAVQSITATAPGAIAGGAMFGNVYIHEDLPEVDVPIARSRPECSGTDGEGGA